jgi:hypothetical protein
MSTEVGKLEWEMQFEKLFLWIKEQFILLINLISKTMDKKVFIQSRGILNRKMIDLAENAGAEFSLNKKIWDVTI